MLRRIGKVAAYDRVLSSLLFRNPSELRTEIPSWTHEIKEQAVSSAR
jgi:hypothetical protein